MATAGLAPLAASEADLLASAGIATSEQLVKALKASQPPASSNPITKIQIARAAWSTSTFFVPKKEQLISHWILDCLCRSAKSQHGPLSSNAKGKAKARDSLGASVASGNDIPTDLDADYWALLNQIVQSQVNAPGTSRQAASQWVNSLISAYPIVTLASSFAKSLSQHPQHSSNQALTVSASEVLKVLLPPACSRSAAANIEHVTEAIQAWLAATPSLDRSSGCQAAATALAGLLDSWEVALELGLNARKNARYFLANSLPAYIAALSAVQHLGSVAPAGLLEALEKIGAASLFTNDVLLAFVGDHADRAMHPAHKESSTKADDDLLDRFRALAQSEEQPLVEATLSSLPVLVRLLTKRLRDEATNLLAPAASTSYSAMSVAAAMQAQEATIRSVVLLKFVKPISTLMQKSSVKAPQHVALASARKQLLLAIEALDLYVPGSPEAEEWVILFRSIMDDAIEDLHTRGGDDRGQRALDSLEALWRLEQMIVEPWLMTILREVATIRVETLAWDANEVLGAEAAAASSFVKTVLYSCSRARDVPRFIIGLYEALTLVPDVSSATMSDVQNGVLLSAVSRTEMAAAVRDFLIPMQVVPLLEELREKTVEIVEEVGKAEHRTASPRPAKRRRSDDGNDKALDDAVSQRSETATQRLDLALQVLTLILPHVSIPRPIREDAIAAAERLYVEAILPAIDLGLDRASNEGLAGALRARSALLLRSWRVDFEEPIRLDGSPENEALPVLDDSLDERRDRLMSLLQKWSCRDGACREAVVETVRALLQRAERDFIGHAKSSDYSALLSSEEETNPFTQALVPIVRDDLVSSGSINPVARWNGKTTDINSSSALASALWFMLTSRLAELIDQLGSGRLLLELSQVLLASAAIDPATSDVAGISRKVIRNAHFLELPRWRSTLLSVANAKTQILAKADHAEQRPTLATLRERHSIQASTELHEALLTLCAMELFPVEWISKTSRETLLDRSLTLDSMLAQKTLDLSETGHQRTSLRRLIGGLMLARGAGPEAASDKMVASLALLVIDESSDAEEGKNEAQQQREDVSLAAFEVGARNLIDSCKTVPTAWSNLLALHQFLVARLDAVEGADVSLAAAADQTLLAGFVGNAKLIANAEYAEAFWRILDGARPLKDNVAMHCNAIQRLIGHTTPSASKASLTQLVHHLKQVRLELILTSACGSEIIVETDRDSRRRSVKQQILALLQPICAVTARVTAPGLEGTEGVGRDVLKTALRVCAETLRLLADCSAPVAKTKEMEVTNAPAAPGDQEEEEAAAAVLKAAIAFAAFASCFGRKDLVDSLSPVLVRILSRMSKTAYDRYLSALMQAVTSDRLGLPTSKDRASLIVAAGVSLQNAPEGGSLSARTHLTELLDYFVQLGNAVPAPIIHAMVEVIEAVCAKKAVLLRSTDVALILQLFTALLTPSGQDAPSADATAVPAQLGQRIFRNEVSTLTSLIRLRPDLMHVYLAHLASLLSSLAALFRRPKSAPSGATATASATATAVGGQARFLRRDLPSWFDPSLSLPLRSEVEARQYARLLTSLTLKTAAVPLRSQKQQHQSEGQQQRKVESLAKPFSKYAVYVIVAYLNAVTHPASAVPPDVRMELEPGLLALCSVVGKHERDAAMIGLLDNAGKALFRNLWKRWEEERYRGQ